MILLTWGFTEPHTAKTAAGLLRYRPHECRAVFDPDLVGQSLQERLEVGGEVPIIGHLADAPDANWLVIGIAPPGGEIPNYWRPVLREALQRGMSLLSGLHVFLSDDDELVRLANEHGGRIVDVRKNSFRQIARYRPFNPDCLRVMTVGHDCSIGKMVTSLELTAALQRQQLNAKFVATGQTGIMISGSGLPLDCIVSDFVSGGAEQLVLDAGEADVLLIEGQGSLIHPSYSGVTLGLLHGARPHALILCWAGNRQRIAGLEGLAIPPADRIRTIFEQMGSIFQPCPTLGVAFNSSGLTPQQAQRQMQQLEQKLELPVCDPIADGTQRLVEAIIAYRQSDRWQGGASTGESL
jgi:uncharacterized NAD-dependent epimerase/dehydratase family protein